MVKEPLSLYFHIPFCTKKCHYCHFYVIPDAPHYKEKLHQSLLLHWEEWLPTLKQYEILTLYFGGGTPYLYGPDYVGQIIEKVKELSNDVEVTLEANPENITLEGMTRYKEVGINRVSIGVQSFNDYLLKTLTRTHNAEKAIEAVKITDQAGIQNISIDLMYDIPYQTLGQWKETLQKTRQLPIHHLSLYNLTIEPRTQFFRNQEKLKPHLPNEDTSKEMYLQAIETMESAGFHQYEISAFAKPNHESRHNSGYWTGREFIGFGPSAFSYFNGERFQNVPNLNQYTKEFKPSFREKLNKKARIRELFVIHLRLMEGVDLERFQNTHGQLEKETQEEIEMLIHKNLLEKEKDKLKLTVEGKLFYDTVASTLC